MQEDLPDPNIVAALIDGWIDPDEVRGSATRIEALLASLAQPDDLRELQWTVDPAGVYGVKALIAQRLEGDPETSAQATANGSD
jgi:hypothetical protein|tara:strand:- start:1335 stop:1586 length:252 start_codon:yes stop_codon:yes gene_type:complete